MTTDAPSNPSHITMCHCTIKGLNFNGEILEAIRCSKAVTGESSHGTILYAKITSGELSLEETKKEIEIQFGDNNKTIKDLIVSMQINKRAISHAGSGQIVGICLENTSLREIRNLVKIS